MNIRLTKRLGFLLLGIWLVVTGLASLGLSFPGLGVILGLLALAAGIVILLER
jgi:hypothetical protein